MLVLAHIMVRQQVYLTRLPVESCQEFCCGFDIIFVRIHPFNKRNTNPKLSTEFAQQTYVFQYSFVADTRIEPVLFRIHVLQINKEKLALLCNSLYHLCIGIQRCINAAMETSFTQFFE